MASCYEDKGCEIATMRANHARMLWRVLGINGTKIAVEGVAGFLAHATALLADALDMFGNALVQGFGRCVLDRSQP